MTTVLTKSALHWMEAHRRRAEARRLLEAGSRTFADLGLRRGVLTDALNEREFESALDVAYRDSARMQATYAVH